MFNITHETVSGGSRTGILHTSHFDVETPCFMPVATKGTVKILTSEDLIDLGVQNIISNAYLLSLRPGTEVIEAAGGLHRFMNWNRCMFTDSGGFQIIREGFEPRVTDSGVLLKSPFDGKEELFTPARCCEVQLELGSDVAMFLDDCAPYGSSHERIELSVERTTRWASEFVETHAGENRKFAITQGGLSRKYRERSARELSNVECDGYGIGGLCIGEQPDEMFKAIGYQIPLLPQERPKYLMGVGSPVDILRSVEMGVDLFDSVYPTRNARHRTALTRAGTMNINATNFKGNLAPVEKECTCPTCRSYTGAYLYHLFKVREMLAMRLLTVHNIHFMMELMRDIRSSIGNGTFEEFKRDFINIYTR